MYSLLWLTYISRIKLPILGQKKTPQRTLTHFLNFDVYRLCVHSQLFANFAHAVLICSIWLLSKECTFYLFRLQPEDYVHSDCWLIVTVCPRKCLLGIQRYVLSPQKNEKKICLNSFQMIVKSCIVLLVFCSY